MITFVKRGFKKGKSNILGRLKFFFFPFFYEKKGRLRFLVNNNKRINSWSYTVCTFNWVTQRGFGLYSVEIIYIFPDSSKLTIHILKTKISGVVESFHIGS